MTCMGIEELLAAFRQHDKPDLLRKAPRRRELTQRDHWLRQKLSPCELALYRHLCKLPSGLGPTNEKIAAELRLSSPTHSSVLMRRLAAKGFVKLESTAGCAGRRVTVYETQAVLVSGRFAK